MSGNHFVAFVTVFLLLFFFKRVPEILFDKPSGLCEPALYKLQFFVTSKYDSADREIRKTLLTKWTGR